MTSDGEQVVMLEQGRPTCPLSTDRRRCRPASGDSRDLADGEVEAVGDVEDGASSVDSEVPEGSEAGSRAGAVGVALS